MQEINSCFIVIGNDFYAVKYKNGVIIAISQPLTYFQITSKFLQTDSVNWNSVEDETKQFPKGYRIIPESDYYTGKYENENSFLQTDSNVIETAIHNLLIQFNFKTDSQSIRLLQTAYRVAPSTDFSSVMEVANAIQSIGDNGTYEAAQIAESLQYHILEQDETDMPEVHPLQRRMLHYMKLEMERIGQPWHDGSKLYDPIIQRINLILQQLENGK